MVGFNKVRPEEVSAKAYCTAPAATELAVTRELLDSLRLYSLSLTLAMLMSPTIEVSEAEAPERLVPIRFMLLLEVRFRLPATLIFVSWLVVF